MLIMLATSRCVASFEGRLNFKLLGPLGFILRVVVDVQFLSGQASGQLNRLMKTLIL